MHQLPSFEPIEQLFPQWLTARPIVEHILPRVLRFEMTGKGTLGVSLDWAQAIIDLVPLEDAQAVRERINAAWGHASAVIDMQPLSVLYRQPANQESLHRADSILESQAREMLAAGKPTPIQILSHVMGITRLYAVQRPHPVADGVTSLREKFEAQALVLAVKHYGYKPANSLRETVLERRKNGTYCVEWVDGAWLGYQAAVEAVTVVSIDQPELDHLYERAKALSEGESSQLVVELGRPFMSGYTENGNHPATNLYSYDDVKSAIEAAGGSVKP